MLGWNINTRKNLKDGEERGFVAIGCFEHSRAK